MQAALTSCDRLHELLEALETILETVQCQIEINEHVVASMKSKKLLGVMDDGSYWKFVADRKRNCEVFVLFLRKRGKTCKDLVSVEIWQSNLGSLRAALVRRTPSSMGALRGLLRTQERALQSIVKGLAVTS